jgi:hypothetical protein
MISYLLFDVFLLDQAANVNLLRLFKLIFFFLLDVLLHY